MAKWNPRHCIRQKRYKQEKKENHMNERLIVKSFGPVKDLDIILLCVVISS